MSAADAWQIFILAIFLISRGPENCWDFIMLWYWHFRANAAQRLSERLEGAVVKRLWAEDALARGATEGYQETMDAVLANPFLGPVSNDTHADALELAIQAKQNIDFESNSGRFKVQFALYKGVQPNQIEQLFKNEFSSCNCGKCRVTIKRRR